MPRFSVSLALVAFSTLVAASTRAAGQASALTSTGVRPSFGAQCKMPVVVPDLARSERMPGSHPPAPGSIGTERFGCSNPLGPRVNTARTRVPERR